MEFLDIIGLRVFLDQLKNIFGYKATLDESVETRRQYLLEIDYEKELAFDITGVGGNSSPYVGSAVVGKTYVA